MRSSSSWKRGSFFRRSRRGKRRLNRRGSTRPDIYGHPIYRRAIHATDTWGRRFRVTSKFERELLRGSLDLMVLSVLAGGKRYGYLIQKNVREASGGRV